MNSEKIVNSINVPIDNCGNTLLFLAISQQDYLLTQVLLRKGADPNHVNKSGISPLTMAQNTGQKSIVNVLIKFGASFKDLKPLKEARLDQLETDKVKLPLFPDSDKRLVRKVQLESKGFTLINAAFLGAINTLLTHVNQDNINNTDKDGFTMLMKASYMGHVELVQVLISKNANVNMTDKYGNNALIWAILMGRDSLIKILIDAGSEIHGTRIEREGKTYIAMTPLVAAAYKGNQDAVEYLLQNGAHPDTRVGLGTGRTAMMIAAWMCHKAVVLILLKNRAFVDASVENWLSCGILTLKKKNAELNPWIDSPEDMHGPGHSVQSSISIQSSVSKVQQKRISMQEKLTYFSNQEIETINEIVALLSKRAGMHGVAADVTNLVASNSKLNIAVTPKATSPKKRNPILRQGLNLEKLIGGNSEDVIKLAEQMPEKGTELDGLWVKLFQCVVQLIMAANKNIKHQYIAISAKLIHCSSEIIRAIEFAEKKYSSGFFASSPIRLKMRKLSANISSEFPKKLMLATRMAIGVWPPPDAIEEMIREATAIASACRALNQLGNALGMFPILETIIDVSFQPFEETEQDENQETEDSSNKIQGGLSYSEYKRQNNLKLIEQLSKKYDDAPPNLSEDEKDQQQDLKFLSTLDSLLKQFVASVTELKAIHDNYLVEDFIKATSTVHFRADTLIEECLGFELLKEIPEELTLDQSDMQRLGISFDLEMPSPIKVIFKRAIELVRSSSQTLMLKGKAAADPGPSPKAAQEMLQATIPCVLGVKKLVVICKEATARVRHSFSEERKKREAWRRECLQNERVKQMFQMWENQVLGDQIPGKAQTIVLKDDELQLLQDSNDGLIFDENKKVKGGRLQQLVQYATNHQVNAKAKGGNKKIYIEPSVGQECEIKYNKQGITNLNSFGMDVSFNLNLLSQDPRAFLDMDAQDFAKQLTLVEFELFAQVQVYECLDQIWGSRRKKETAAYRDVKKHELQKSGTQITKLINHTNQIGLWVATTILNTEQLKQRLLVMKYFIHLTTHCKELNNLTGVTTILAGLNMGPVERLKKTWAALQDKHPKSMEAFKEILPLASPKFQYAQYRKYVKDMVAPGIPFLGVYLTDLTFIEDGNSDFLPDSYLINFDKRFKVYHLIKEKVVAFQKTPYEMVAISQVVDFIRNLSEKKGAHGWNETNNIMTYEELEQVSLKLEPLEIESDDD